MRSCDKATPHQNKKELRIKPCARWLHRFTRFLFFARLCPPPPFPLSRSSSDTPQKTQVYSVVFYYGRLPQQNTTSRYKPRHSCRQGYCSCPHFTKPSQTKHKTPCTLLCRALLFCSGRLFSHAKRKTFARHKATAMLQNTTKGRR